MKQRSAHGGGGEGGQEGESIGLAALHQRDKGNSLPGTLAEVSRGLIPACEHLVPDKDQQLRMHLAN